MLKYYLWNDMIKQHILSGKERRYYELVYLSVKGLFFKEFDPEPWKKDIHSFICPFSQQSIV